MSNSTSPTRLTKKQLAADSPTWCPACGHYSVLASYFKVLESLQIPHQNIVTLAGIGCSSRIPYFVNSHGAHFIHGRAIPLGVGVSLARPDLKVFVFSGDGDAYSIGGNHLDHAARRNVDLTYVIMDNFLYGLTKKQSSPTTPMGFKTKTDPIGVQDRPLNPIRKILASGATFIARTHSGQIKHMTEMLERAARHKGFAVVECLTDCKQFYPDSCDAANPKKGGQFETIDETQHDITDSAAAAKLAEKPWPGIFGVYYQIEHPSKNEIKAQRVARAREGVGEASDMEILSKTLARFR